MNDDLLTALRADLDAFVGEPGPPPASPRPGARIPDDQPRRPWLAFGAAAATIAVVVAGLAVIARRDDPEVGDAPLPAATMPVPPTPDGWTVVEWGDLRLSVPPELDPFTGVCTTTPDRDAAAMRIECAGRTLTVMSGSVGIVGLEEVGATTRNGLTTQLTPVPDLGAATQLLVADTQSLVRFEGFGTTDIEGIADTVGVSSTWRASNEPAPPVPDDWQLVSAPGLTLRVPPNWPVDELGPDEPRPGACGFAGMTGRVTRALGTSDVAVRCPLTVSVLVPPSDGVWVSELRADESVPADESLPIIDRIVSTGDHRYLVRVGFGVDGTIGRTILGSITVPDPPGTTVTTAPDGPEPVTPWVQIEYQGEAYVIEIDRIPWPEDPADWVPVEWGQIRFALPPQLSPFAPQTGCAASTWGEFDDHLRITCGNTTIEAGSDLLADAPIVGTTDTIPVANPDADTIASPIYGGLRITGVDEATRVLVLSTATVSTGWRAQNTYVGDDVSPWPTPGRWQRVRHGDMEFAVPPDWPVTNISSEAADPDQCSFVKGDESLPGAIPTDAVLLGRGAVTSDADCDEPVLAPLRNGVRAFSTTEAERPSGVSAYDQADQALGGVSASGTIVRVGVGADQLTALTILGSIRILDAEPTTPPTTTSPGVPSASEYASIGTVIDDGDGVQLCLAVLESLPPQCGAGFRLDGFDWDGVDGEQSVGGGEEIPATTWLDDVFVRGTWDDAAFALSVTTANLAAETDRDLLVQMHAAVGESRAAPDYSIPCEPPDGGWDRPATDPILSWPGEQVAALAGYAGSWIGPERWVFTVKFTGDLTDAGPRVRALYDGPLCVVGARYDEAELDAIATELRSLSSVQVLESAIYVDATGEWVEGTTILPAPDLQASLDERYGEGTVRLRSYLVPLPAP